MEKDVAVITPGGGMRCAYSAGAVVALAKEFGASEPGIFFASSGSVGTMFYFLARQYDAIERIWTRHLATRRFISFLRPWRIMDIDWLVDDVFRRIDPLDTRAVEMSRTEWNVPLTEKGSGNVRFVRREDSVDVFDLMRAAKAVPFVYGRAVVLNGRKYVDGDLSKPLRDAPSLLPTHISRVVVFETETRVRTTEESVGRGQTIIRIRPNRKHLHRVSTNKACLARAFEAGYEDCARNSSLRSVFI